MSSHGAPRCTSKLPYAAANETAIEINSATRIRHVAAADDAARDCQPRKQSQFGALNLFGERLRSPEVNARAPAAAMH